jgi:hypothetical protein
MAMTVQFAHDLVAQVAADGLLHAAPIRQSFGVAVTTCGPNTLCFQLAQGIPAGLVALAIGIVGAVIAWRQYQTARAKLKLDLFDRRYEIFMATWSHLSSVVQNGPELKNETSQAFEILKKFRNNIPQAGFLFGKEIERYLDEIHEKQMEAWELRLKYDLGDLSQQEIVRKTELTNWFINEARDAKRRFRPYLDLRSWQ